MSNFPTWESKPLLLATCRDTCVECDRMFELHAYCEADAEKLDGNMGVLLRNHHRTSHQATGEAAA